MKLFGGDTMQFAKLTAKQRMAKKTELAEMLRRIGIADRMVHPNYNDAERVERAVRTWLDAQTKQIPTAYASSADQRLRQAALGFFRACEIFRDEKYLNAGLTCADRILKEQLPRGHWAY